MFSQSNGLRFNRDAASSTISETICDGLYFADLFSNQKIEPPVYHYIITRKGSSEILDWGQGFSLAAMKKQAEDWLANEARKIA